MCKPRAASRRVRTAQSACQHSSSENAHEAQSSLLVDRHPSGHTHVRLHIDEAWPRHRSVVRRRPVVVVVAVVAVVAARPVTRRRSARTFRLTPASRASSTTSGISVTTARGSIAGRTRLPAAASTRCEVCDHQRRPGHTEQSARHGDSAPSSRCRRPARTSRRGTNLVLARLATAGSQNTCYCNAESAATHASLLLLPKTRRSGPVTRRRALHGRPVPGLHGVSARSLTDHLRVDERHRGAQPASAGH